nr:helix-turn-helix domain-containing protein [Streptomyces gossypiisoli]
MEVLHQAGRLGHRYTPVLASPRGGDVITSSGLALARTLAAADVGPVDTLVVAGADLLAEQSPGEELLAAAAVLAERTPRVASVCSGAFRLADLATALVTPPTRSDLLRSLTASAAVSARHLTRLFQAELNTTPARWVERVRLDRAQQLLLDGHSVTSAAHHSGLGSDETLRRAFARHLGTTPTEYRRRFTTTRPQDSSGEIRFERAATPDVQRRAVE